MNVNDLVAGLDIAVERVKQEFYTCTSALNNSQVEYICNHLIEYFKEKLELIHTEQGAEEEGEFDYDKFLKEVMSIPPREKPTWIPCRSVEEAEAFACWCIENGIEEPEIIVRGG